MARKQQEGTTLVCRTNEEGIQSASLASQLRSLPIDVGPRRTAQLGLWGACLGFAYPFCVSVVAMWFSGLPYGVYSDSLDTVAWLLGGAVLYSVLFVLVPIRFRAKIGDQRTAVLWGASVWMGTVAGVHAGHKVWRGWGAADGWGGVEFLAILVIGGVIASVLAGGIWRGATRLLDTGAKPSL